MTHKTTVAAYMTAPSMKKHAAAWVFIIMLHERHGPFFFGRDILSDQASRFNDVFEDPVH